MWLIVLCSYNYNGRSLCSIWASFLFYRSNDIRKPCHDWWLQNLPFQGVQLFPLNSTHDGLKGRLFSGGRGNTFTPLHPSGLLWAHSFRCCHSSSKWRRICFLNYWYQISITRVKWFTVVIWLHYSSNCAPGVTLQHHGLNVRPAERLRNSLRGSFPFRHP